jgi:hypothetical protein
MSSTTKKYILKYDPTVPEVIAAVTVVKERIANSCTLVAPDYTKEFFLSVRVSFAKTEHWRPLLYTNPPGVSLTRLELKKQLR